MALGAAAAVLLVAGIGLLVADPLKPAPELSTAARLAAAPSLVGKPAGSIEHLTIASGSKRATATGVALVNRKVLTTTASVPDRAIVWATDLDGNPVAALTVATDPTLGLTVLAYSVPVVERSAELSDHPPSSALTAVALTGRSGGEVSWSSAELRSADTIVATEGASIGTITATGALSRSPASVLADASGRTAAIADPGLSADAYLPATFAAAISEDLLAGGDEDHAHLGVSCRSTADGVVITKVDAGSPAAGTIAVGDLISSVGGRRVSSASELVNAVYLADPGTEITVVLTRDARTLRLGVTPSTGP